MSLPAILKKKLTSLGATLEDTFLVAVSGGADSTALLLALEAALGESGGLIVAHLDHGVRSGSEKDQEKVEELCRDMGVELVTGQLDPAELEVYRRSYGSLEAAMRLLRYRFLFETARKLGSKWILTGHTADDQAETILFRVTRDMDWRSLGGIPERRGSVLRPLIEVPRSATWSYCLAMGITPVSDPSNLDEVYARSRIRNRVLPGLAATFTPDIPDLLRRMGRAAGSLSLSEEKLLDRFMPEASRGDTGLVQRKHILALPKILQNRLMAGYLVLTLGEYPSRSLVDNALEFVLAGRNGELTLPGDMTLTLSYGLAHIGKAVTGVELSLPSTPLELKIPGILAIPSAGIVITAKESALKVPGSFPGGRTVLLAKNSVRGPLRVRKRLPGDRFMPLGMKREKKLKDFLVDRKVPRAARDLIPIVVDGQNNILWVGGIEISQKAALDGVEGEKTIQLHIEDLSQEVPPIRNPGDTKPRRHG